MSIQDEIAAFGAEFKTVRDELDIVENKLVDAFESKMLEIRPIVQYCKSQGFRFHHPDLDPEIWTTVGPILGRSYRDRNEVYVYAGKTPLIHQVMMHDRESASAVDPMSFRTFFCNCNLDFALRGIEYTRNCFPRIIEEIKNDIATKMKFIGE